MLLKRLYKTRDNELRPALHEQVTKISKQLRLPMPPLDAIGIGVPGVAERLVPQGAALRRLEDLRVPFCHSKKPEQSLGLHWGSLKRAFAANRNSSPGSAGRRQKAESHASDITDLWKMQSNKNQFDSARLPNRIVFLIYAFEQ